MKIKLEYIQYCDFTVLCIVKLLLHFEAIESQYCNLTILYGLFY